MFTDYIDKVDYTNIIKVLNGNKLVTLVSSEVAIDEDYPPELFCYYNEKHEIMELAKMFGLQTVENEEFYEADEDEEWDTHLFEIFLAPDIKCSEIFKDSEIKDYKKYFKDVCDGKIVDDIWTGIKDLDCAHAANRVLNEIDRTNEREMWLGILFSYPQCCVKYFIESVMLDKKPRIEHEDVYAGYVMCEDCLKNYREARHDFIQDVINEFKENLEDKEPAGADNAQDTVEQVNPLIKYK